ncbi:MAG: hypothetical protein PHQ28_00120 [Mycobacterium sp.]|nr:hypothetical protein [Mycobacterium sp.]
MNYPADILNNDGEWGRVHLGHSLDREQLRKDLLESNVETPPRDDAGIVVEEVHFGYLPRVKWCADYVMGGCDLAGEWHSHWYSVQPQRPENAMTLVRWAA